MYYVINLQSITRAYGKVDADGSRFLLGDHLISFPQVEVKSFPAKTINLLACNTDGTYIVGGGVSGHIYLWEVATGRLLKKWHGHYRLVTCLVFSNDQSLLIFGFEDGTVRFWSLLMIFDEEGQQRAGHLYEYSFTGHALPVTNIVTGYGGSNAIILSAALDRTCKVWSLTRGTLLRNIVFPSIIDVVALDQGEHVFYACGRDGKIYIAELNAQVTSNNSNNNYGLHIIGTLSDQSKAICSLGFALDGYQLVVGSEDGMAHVWDTKIRNIICVLNTRKVKKFKYYFSYFSFSYKKIYIYLLCWHLACPVNNIVVMRQLVALYP
uniref:Neurobeachin beta-propeller domain-containing protein n=1 Tax=Lactuca sativa TaxID=4236 RepID=A0A9R1XPA7_LACSA|nr:hypothetical protein LSAT_V11C400162720 [Lactuca sativa]